MVSLVELVLEQNISCHRFFTEGSCIIPEFFHLKLKAWQQAFLRMGVLPPKPGRQERKIFLNREGVLFRPSLLLLVVTVRYQPQKIS